MVLTSTVSDIHHPKLQAAALSTSVSPVSIIWHALRTCYAFTQSDYKTIVFPVLVYACMATPMSMIDPTILPRLYVWIFVHLLQFCAANQTYSFEEDALNKPYRPVPSGLISPRGALVFRWILVPLCLGLSHLWDVTYAGFSLAAAFIAYNEFGLDSHWCTKSLLNAIGIVSWNVGAAQIVRGAYPFASGETWMAPLLSVALIWTTMHIQDFRDEAGDRLQGRVTIPILLPEWSRRLTPIQIIMWSVGLVTYWNTNIWWSCAFVSLGAYLAARIYYQRSEYEDKVSLRWYMVWLTMAQVSPFQMF